MAYAQVQNEHVWQTAWAKIIQDKSDAAGRGREGVQAGRGDLREFPPADRSSGAAIRADRARSTARKPDQRMGVSTSREVLQPRQPTPHALSRQ